MSSLTELVEDEARFADLQTTAWLVTDEKEMFVGADALRSVG